MKIAVTGATGLVGKHLLPFLAEKGHEVYSLVRQAPQNERQIMWNSEQGFVPSELRKLENFDAVVHLAGAGIADERWSKARKRVIKESRTAGTTVLVNSLAQLQNPPKTFVSASAIGYYGNRADDVLTEDAPPDNSFLADVCVEWEAAANRARIFNARTAILRIGIVLSTEGGALKEMLKPFKMGVGGRVGKGTQFVSWIALLDLLRVVEFTLQNQNLSGAINVTAPNPVRNQEFAEILGKLLNRPAAVPTPEFAVRLMFGELADALLFASARVVPKKLLEQNFQFRFVNIEDALRHLLQ